MKPKRPIKIAKQPIYEGGQKALKKMINDNLQYPEEALKNNITGHVIIKYDINHKGKIIKTKIIKSLGYGCDEEAVRLVKLLNFNIPKSRKLKLIFHKTIRIPFLKKKVITKTQINYSYSSSTNNSSKKNKPSSGYEYTISKMQ